MTQLSKSAVHLVLMSAATLFLAADIIQLTVNGNLWAVVVPMSSIAFLGLMFLPDTLPTPTDRVARAGSFLTLVGIAGNGTENWSLPEFQHFARHTYISQFTTLLFPIGLLVFSVALFRARGALAALAFAASALLFATALATELSAILLAGKVAVLIAFSLLPFGVRGRPDRKEASPNVVDLPPNPSLQRTTPR